MKARISLGLRGLFLLMPIGLVPFTATAETIAERERTARTACLAGDYAKGVALLAELFVDTNERTYLYNQGRCFEQNGRYEKAITRFHEFLQKLQDAGAPSDPDTEKHIATCQARIAQAKGLPVVARAPEPAKEPAPTPTGVHQGLAPNEGGDSWLRTATITTLAVGGVGVLTGLILNLQANSLANELESTRDNYQQSKESRRAKFETYGWVSYGVGAACLATGAVLYLVGRNQGNDPSVALFPTVSPDATGAVLQGAF